MRSLWVNLAYVHCHTPYHRSNTSSIISLQKLDPMYFRCNTPPFSILLGIISWNCKKLHASSSIWYPPERSLPVKKLLILIILLSIILYANDSRWLKNPFFIALSAIRIFQVPAGCEDGGSKQIIPIHNRLEIFSLSHKWLKLRDLSIRTKWLPKNVIHQKAVFFSLCHREISSVHKLLGTLGCSQLLWNRPLIP